MREAAKCFFTTYSEEFCLRPKLVGLQFNRISETSNQLLELFLQRRKLVNV